MEVKSYEPTDITDIKRDYIKRIDILEKEHKNFKRRISIIFNLFIPGLGFLIYGEGLLKGLVSFVLFYGYLYFHYKAVVPNTDFSFALFYLFPAVIIWFSSTILLSALSD